MVFNETISLESIYVIRIFKTISRKINTKPQYNGNMRWSKYYVVDTCWFATWLFFFLMFIYILERERQCESRGGAEEREGDTESKAGSRLWAVSRKPKVRFEPTNPEIMTWAKVRRSTNRATQVPQHLFYLSSRYGILVFLPSLFLDYVSLVY